MGHDGLAPLHLVCVCGLPRRHKRREPCVQSCGGCCGSSRRAPRISEGPAAAWRGAFPEKRRMDCDGGEACQFKARGAAPPRVAVAGRHHGLRH